MRQILAGFKHLHRDGVINLTKINFDTTWVKDTKNRNDFVKKGSLLKADINDRTVVYDMHDSIRLNDEALSECDAYIKRSYSAQYHTANGKIYPLGLYLNAVEGSIDIDRAKLMYNYASGSGRIIGILNSLTGRDYPSYSYIERSFNASLPPRALFLARLWPPDQTEDSNQRQERESINQNRTECVLKLRKQFDDRFLGGIIPDSFSTEYCPEAIVQDDSISKRRNYLKLLKEYPVCISTQGLHGSTGAKFSEYIAFGKAVVSEQLCHDLPPNMLEGTHLLQYTNIEECVEKTGLLLENHSIRENMMYNNKLYYEQELKPEIQILKSILRIL